MISASVSAAIEDATASYGYLASAAVGLLYLALLARVIVAVWRTAGLSPTASAVWLAAVVFVPLAGMAAWFVFGPRVRRGPAASA